MFNYDPSKFEDRIAARKLAEDLGLKNAAPASDSGLSLKGIVWLFVLIAACVAIFGD